MEEARLTEQVFESLAALAATAEPAVPGTEDVRPAAPGVGTDLVRISRIDAAVERWGESFLAHLFTEEEITFCRSKQNPLQHFAGTLATKEAVYKALGMQRDQAFSWRMIEVVRDAAGRPRVRSSHYASERVRRELDGTSVRVSISHEGEYAVAVAVAHPQRSD